MKTLGEGLNLGFLNVRRGGGDELEYEGVTLAVTAGRCKE